MKKNSPIFQCLSHGLLLLSLVLSGCIDDQVKPGGESVALSVGQVKAAQLKTRSTTAVTSGNIGVFLSGTGYTTKTNVMYSYGTLWTTTDPLYLMSDPATICAYYPYSSGITDATAVPLSSQLYSTTADLCYATNTNKSKVSPNIDFVMSRAYARLTLSITHEESYTGACTISNVTLANAGICTSGSLNISTGTLSSTTVGTVSLPLSTNITVAANTTSSIQVLMVPVATAMTGNVMVSFTVDGVVCSSTISANSLPTLEVGTNYIINASMGKTGLNTFLMSVSGTGTLSMNMTANCYILAPGSSLIIPVNIKGNGDVTLASLVGGSTSFTAASVGVLWQTANGLVTCSDFNSTTQTVTVNAPATGVSGNAVIAAYDGDGTTVFWSWHIWVTSYDPDTKTNGTTYSYTNTSSVTNMFMDRNLGATSVAPADVNTLGLMYQWGRKDPFVNASTYTGSTDLPVIGMAMTKTSGATTIANTILAPATFYMANDWNSTPNTTLWGGLSYGAMKTIFDPCPSGWRVPSRYKTSTPASPWLGLASYATAATYWSTNGCNWSATTPPNLGFWPATGRRESGSGTLAAVGSLGYFWEATNLGIYIGNGSVNTNSSGPLGCGYAVRCVQEW